MSKQRYDVSSIEIDCGKGSFEEWANAIKEQDPDDIARWQAAYYAQVTEALQQAFSRAEIDVFEGYDYLMRSKLAIQYTQTPDGAFEADADFVDMLDDKVELIVEDVFMRVSNDGSFWDA